MFHIQNQHHNGNVEGKCHEMQPLKQNLPTVKWLFKFM